MNSEEPALGRAFHVKIMRARKGPEAGGYLVGLGRQGTEVERFSYLLSLSFFSTPVTSSFLSFSVFSLCLFLPLPSQIFSGPDLCTR